MLIQYYLEQYTMPYSNPACDMDVNHGGKHKHKSYKKMKKIQNKALRIINFKNPRQPSEQMFKEATIFKLKDIITISNLNNILPRAFENFFINKIRQHLYNTRGNSLDVQQVKKQKLVVPTYSHYIQFVHGIPSRTNSASLHRSLT